MELDSDRDLPHYAEDFFAIPAALARSPGLLEAMSHLIATQPIAGKVTEGFDRTARLRAILTDLAHGRIGYHDAFFRAEVELPRRASPYAKLTGVFPDGWGERLVRIQFSRFYNQTVMERLLADGETECQVPHSRNEVPHSRCTRSLAGRNHDLRRLHNLLVQAYAFGRWEQDVAKIPDHPHCTHVIVPIRAAAPRRRS